MKISEMLRKLEGIRSEYGDIQIGVCVAQRYAGGCKEVADCRVTSTAHSVGEDSDSDSLQNFFVELEVE